ncbi:hypothetical protein HGRIS_011176 [Hohenbuehelia grisea]|uniref:Uncharacterized protein n=1 Tax=Hohenbuehelia grisea TaxID=104357 RepID=A0ABR3JUC4_9AGAR
MSSSSGYGTLSSNYSSQYAALLWALDRFLFPTSPQALQPVPVVANTKRAFKSGAVLCSNQPCKTPRAALRFTDAPTRESHHTHSSAGALRSCQPFPCASETGNGAFPCLPRFGLLPWSFISLLSLKASHLPAVTTPTLVSASFECIAGLSHRPPFHIAVQ